MKVKKSDVWNDCHGCAENFCSENEGLLLQKGFVSVYGADDSFAGKNSLICNYGYTVRGKVTKSVVIEHSELPYLIIRLIDNWKPLLFEPGEDNLTEFVFKTEGASYTVGYFQESSRTLYTTDLLSFKFTFPLLQSILTAIPDQAQSVNLDEKIIVTIGMDPEFEPIDPYTYRHLDAYDVLFPFFKDDDGDGYYDEYDEWVPTSDEIEMTGDSFPIGTDGRSDTLEIRPEANTNIYSVVENVRKLIYEVRNYYQIGLSVKGDNKPLGAHIHFGIGYSYNPDKNLLYLLDYFLGKKCYMKSGKARDSYGRLSNAREKYYGFEYRTLPSAIMQSPEVLLVFLKIARNVVQRYFDGIAFEISGKRWATKSEYMQYCRLSLKEWKNLQSFLKSEVPYFDICKNWLKDKGERLSIQFQDEWKNSSQTMVSKLCKDVLKGYDGDILFYGLKECRGKAISGFSVEGYDSIDSPVDYRLEYDHYDFTIGLPFSFRVDGIDQELILEGLKKRILSLAQGKKEDSLCA